MSKASGDHYEALACRFLQQQGLTLVERNWHCRQGELDLVMRDGACWVFVEVRARQSAHFGGAAASIGSAKQHKLHTAANLYLSSKRIDAPAVSTPCCSMAANRPGG
ncbi:YraN family protein [Vogesella fluminis]|uniref:YraN family protein n=1 Tax=Vogesella fluminis TaxID=1069161 RepID=UPI003639539F